MELDTPESRKTALVEAWQGVMDRDWETFDEVFADDVYFEAPGAELHERAGVKEYMDTWLTAFPDFEIEFEEVVTEDNLLCARFRTQGTHQGELWGIPATGNQFEGQGMSMNRIEDGRIVEEINVWNELEVFDQLGIDPAER